VTHIVIAEQQCAVVDNATDAPCGFVGDVEVTIFNQTVDDGHGDIAWTCPKCQTENLDTL
jgi:hypothetical protein